jgi:hypothetical protein
METLFRPCRRWEALLLENPDRRDHRLPNNLAQVELLPHLTPRDIRATGVTWKAFCCFLRDKVVWMTPDVFVASRYDFNPVDPMVLRLGDHATAAAGGSGLDVHVTPGTVPAAATATCDFLLLLLATSEFRFVTINGRDSAVPPPISGQTLSLFFQESRDDLQKVWLDFMILNEDQCLALATMSRLDVELTMNGCSLSNGAAGAFVEFLQSDRGPVKLQNCNIDSRIIASALTGDSRVTRFRPRALVTNDADIAVLFTALANNRGLVDLDLNSCSISSDNWSILCESLKAHPSLTGLVLLYTSRSTLSDEQKAHRTCLLAEMMKENTVLHTIHLSANERDEQIYTEEIHPHLETNLYRPRVLIVKKTTERPFREKILGRALYCVRSSPNLVWMFLSENVDAFVRSEEEEEEGASNSEVPVAVAAAVVVELAGCKRKY